MTGISLPLSAYPGSLVSLLARADEFGISANDLLVLQNILLLLSGLLWTSISCTSVVTSQRRQLALSELGVLERDIPSLCEGIPSSEQFFVVVSSLLCRSAASGSRQRAPSQAPRRPPFQAPRRSMFPARVPFVSQSRSGCCRGSARGGPRSSVKPFPLTKRPF